MQCGKLEAFSRQLFGNPREGSTKKRKTKYNKVHKARAMQLGEQASKQALDNNSNRRRSDYMKFAIIFIIIIIAITLSPRLSAAFNSSTSCFFVGVFVSHSQRVAHHWKFTPLFVRLLFLNEFSSLVSPQVEQYRRRTQTGCEGGMSECQDCK